MFFIYPELIQIYKNNAKVLIYDYIYSVVKSELLLLCFDFVSRLGTVLLLAYILIPNKTYKGYLQAFQQLQRLFEEYKINNLEVFIYDRDRAAINVLIEVFLYTNTILYTQYIDTVVRVYTVKTFGQQKNEETNKYILSELTQEFLTLYWTYRYVLTEDTFNEVYAAFNERAIYGQNNIYESDDDEYFNAV